MDFNFDTGSIYGGLQTLDVTTLPPLGGTAGVLTIVGDGAITVPLGTQVQRPGTPSQGMFRFNTDTTLLEYYDGTQWSPLSTSSSTVSSVAANSNSSSLTITGSPITSAGTFQFTLDAGLEALGTFSSTGLLVATGANTWGSATITGTSGNISVTNGNGVSGNPTIDLATVTQAATGNFVKVTLDTFGRVTGNTAVTTSDITSLVDGTYVNINGDTMASGANLTFVGGGEVLGLPQTPTADDAAASKYYVDSIAAGLSWKQAVEVASTTNIDLTTGGLIAVDGVTVVDGDRVLVKNQTSLPENGIYIAHSGAWVRSTDMDSTTPINEVNGAAVYVITGTTQANTGWTQIDVVTTIGTDPIEWAQFSGTGSYTGGNGITVSGNIISLQTPVTVANGGTGTSTIPTNGQLLIGNGTGYTVSTLTAGTAIGISNNAGSITITNDGVTSLSGTTNEVTVSASTGAITVGLPDDVTVTSSLTVSGLSANSALYTGAAGLLSATALTNGQLLIGSTGNAPVASTITGGTGVNVTNGAGSITIDIDNTEVVTSFSAGTTGLTPSTATTGDVVLGGTLATTNGGTGLTSIGSANQILGVNAGATGLEYKTVSAGTGISVTNGANVITVANAGVTGFTLSDTSTTAIYDTTPLASATGNVGATIQLKSQTANTVFAAPNGSAGQPSFRALSYADLPLQLYAENPSTVVAPDATGDNAVAIGSGSSSTADGTFAQGSGSDARIYGQRAYANGAFATAGDAQHGVYVARNITTNNTLTELFLDGSAVQLVMPDNSVFTFDILVAARRTDATGGGAAYRFVGVAKKDTTAGSVTFIGTPSKTVIGETNTPWDAAVSVDTSTGAFRVRVTGENSKTIRWVATIQTTEVTN